MTPDALADLHRRAMTTPAPWSAADFADLLAGPGVFLVLAPSSVEKYPGGAQGGKAPSPAEPDGFALGRVTLDEAELLTLAVAPAFQRQGVGRACLDAFEARAFANGAKSAFLEVAATNQPAVRLYLSAGWADMGLRPGYYRTPTGRIDARLMRKPLAPA